MQRIAVYNPGRAGERRQSLRIESLIIPGLPRTAERTHKLLESVSLCRLRRLLPLISIFSDAGIKIFIKRRSILAVIKHRLTAVLLLSRHHCLLLAAEKSLQTLANAANAVVKSANGI